MFQSEAFGAESVLSILDDEYLRQHGADPYAVEYRVGEESLEHISLAVYFSSVDLVEQGHHDERVEDDGEVLGGFRAKFGTTTGRYVEHLVAGEQQRKDYRKLVDGLTDDVLHHSPRYQRFCPTVWFTQQQVRGG